MDVSSFRIGSVEVGGGKPLVLIAGPCVIEGLDVCLRIARRVREICEPRGVPFIFKASYDKANRTSARAFRGPGIEAGLRVLETVQREVDVPVLTDVHTAPEARRAGEVVDAVQVPAFLCRQTDLLLAAAGTGKAVNVKKGQFLAPWDMRHVVEKVVEAGGNRRLLLTERGASFGYNNLVSDMRSLPILRRLGFPVVFDGTHSVQLPGGADGRSGGQAEFIPTLVRAAVAAGVDAIFLETHEDPARSMSDRDNALHLDRLPAILDQALAMRRALDETGWDDSGD